MEPWMKWFKSVESKIVDQVGLRNGKEVTKEGVSVLDMDMNAITGFLVIKAENMDEALEIAQSGPMIKSTKVYEMVT